MTSSSNTLWRIVLSCWAGTVLEWYDFAIFLFLSPVISQLFYPHQDAHTSLFITYAVFAAGYCTRPLGGFLFGHLGDRRGRKQTLLISLLLITVPTVLMGLLPTYAQAGLLASVALLLLRALQGFAVGGETAGAMILAYESVPEHQRAWVTMVAWMGTGVGILLGSGVVALLTKLLSDVQVHQWGWRIPFLLSVTTGIVGYWLRSNIYEAELFQRVLAKQRQFKQPVLEVFRCHKRLAIRLIILYIPIAVVYFVILMFIPTYLAKMNYFSYASLMHMNTLTLLITKVIELTVCWLAYRYGHRWMMWIGILGLIITSIPLYELLFMHSLWLFLLVQIGFMLFISLYVGGVLANSFAMVDTSVRYSTIALTYNFSMLIFSGSAPVVVGYLSGLSFTLAPIIYVIALCCVVAGVMVMNGRCWD